mgnify:CR=1 FL=1
MTDTQRIEAIEKPLHPQTPRLLRKNSPIDLFPAPVQKLPPVGQVAQAEPSRGEMHGGMPQPIRVGGKERLGEAVVATGFPYDKDRDPDNNTDNVVRILPHVRGLRRFGAAAYDLCCVAAGTMDGYWELALHEWDVCAGELIVQEAGGVTERILGISSNSYEKES